MSDRRKRTLVAPFTVETYARNGQRGYNSTLGRTTTGLIWNNSCSAPKKLFSAICRPLKDNGQKFKANDE